VSIGGNGGVCNEMIYLGADHRGFELKEKLKIFLADSGYDYKDLGASIYNREDDYPDFAKLVAEKIKGEDKGILICGSGIGIDIAANRFKGVRAGLAIDAKQIAMARNDDDINILVLASDFLSDSEAKEIVKTFLNTKFSGEERHIRRVKKIEKF
jgi:ribose 5-phosphate isomerase B